MAQNYKTTQDATIKYTFGDDLRPYVYDSDNSYQISRFVVGGSPSLIDTQTDYTSTTLSAIGYYDPRTPNPVGETIFVERKLPLIQSKYNNGVEDKVIDIIGLDYISGEPVFGNHTRLYSCNADGSGYNSNFIWTDVVQTTGGEQPLYDGGEAGAYKGIFNSNATAGKFFMNIIIGSKIMSNNRITQNTDCEGNIFIGKEIAADSSGTMSADWNIVIGQKAGYKLYSSASQYNVYIGYEAGYSGKSTTKYNTFIGNEAGRLSYQSQRYNTCIGHEADTSSTTNCENEFTLGNDNVASLRCNQTSISSLSDARDKTMIEDYPAEGGLAFINSLKPRTFYWDRRKWYNEKVPIINDEGKADYEIVPHTPDGSKVELDYIATNTSSGQHMGFVSQEVQESIDGKKYFEGARIVYDNNADFLETKPAELIVPLVKAVQQLSDRLDALES